jgi:uncharacterized protein (UPF0264 family)
MTGMLASVRDLDEALLALAAGTDLIDLKAPARGALGALPRGVVRNIVDRIGGRRPVSATVGDLPMEPLPVREAAENMAACGVDYVKIGFFPGGDWAQTITALTPLAARGNRLVAVLFGDRNPDARWLADIAAAGFTGAMLDTMDKERGSLTRVCSISLLRDFVSEAKGHGLLCGLAGSLRPSDIPPLLQLNPDYLGFRGALCHAHRRTAELDAEAVRAIRALISRSGRKPAPPQTA